MEHILTYLQRQTKISYKTIMNDAWNDEIVQNAIIHLNTRSQLFNKGIDSDGDSLGDYSTGSVEFYGKRPGHIQLFDTGDFYKSFRIRVTGVDAEIDADTQVSPDTNLTDRFGIDIIGLTDESKEVLSNIITTVFEKKIREILQVN